MNYISADDFRVNGEKAVLYITLVSVAVGIIFLTKISLVFVSMSLAFSVIWVKLRQGQLLGQSIKVSENQLPEVYEIAKTASRRLSMRMPDIFITQDPVINAYAIGFLSKNSIVLNSATVEAMTKDELLAIIGHEATHVKANHTNWLVITNSTNSINIPLISQVLGFFFLFWSRKAEYTSDRGALLACREPQAVITALAKVSIGKGLFEKLNIGNLSSQKVDLDENQIAKLSETLSTHPFFLNRIHEIQKFYKSTEYSHLTDPSTTNIRSVPENEGCLWTSSEKERFTGFLKNQFFEFWDGLSNKARVGFVFCMLFFASIVSSFVMAL